MIVKKLFRRLRDEIRAYRLALADSRTPKLAKWLLRFILGYMLSPIDLIPDFIPVVGLLDDLVILPTALCVAHRLIPKKVLADCRKRANLHEAA